MKSTFTILFISVVCVITIFCGLDPRKFLAKLFDFLPHSRTPKKHYLIIDDRCISCLKDRMLGREPIKSSKHLRSQISILAYNPGYTFNKCLDTEGRLITGSTITIRPKLYLYCGNFEYSFPANFSQAELWWLGKELSDFLNLELQVIYPTPKVPSAPTCGGGC